MARDPRDAIWIEPHHLKDPEIAAMVGEVTGGLRDHADEVERDPALGPTAGLPAPGNQED
jgi:hypothetical protein